MKWTRASKVTTSPASEPLTTTQAKNWLKVDTSADDTLIDALIAATRTHIEESTGLALFTQTVTDVLDAWPVVDEVDNPRGAFTLLRGPVQSVSSIQYYDTDGVQQTLGASVYTVDTTSRFARVGLADGQSYPALDNRLAPITVTYVAGYAQVGDIPADLIVAMRLLLTYYYEKRADSVQQFRTTAEHLISKHYTPIV